jgi:hypothetical protein
MAHIRSMQPVILSNLILTASTTDKILKGPPNLSHTSKLEAVGMRSSKCLRASETPTILLLGSLDQMETEV